MASGYGTVNAGKRSKALRYRSELGYFPAIDGLRALAVVSVALYHLDTALIPAGYVGVDIFFVISGFVVTASVLHLDFSGVRDILVYFYARRVRRILPALVTTLVIVTIAYALFVPRAYLNTTTQTLVFASFFGVSNVVLATQEDDYFAPRSEFNPYIHTWTLGVEEQFYLLFPFIFFYILLFRFHRFALGALAFCILLSIIASAVMTPVSPKYAFYLLPPRFWELGCGMLLCLAIGRWRPYLARLPKLKASLLFACSAALILFGLLLPSEVYFPFPLALLPVFGTVGVIAFVCARPLDFPARALAWAPVVGIGKMSYSLYLWHWPIFVLFRWTVGLQGPVMPIFALSLVAITGACSYRFVELPPRRADWIRRVAPSKVVIGGLAVVCLGTLIAVTAFRHSGALSLSTTADINTWYTSGPIPRSPIGCEIENATRPFAGGTITKIRATNCSAATAKGRIFVIGNSHALAYSRLLREFSSRTGHEVELLNKPTCTFLPLYRPMSNDRQCRAFHGEAIRYLTDELETDDILFMPSLRLERYASQDGLVQENAKPKEEVQQTRKVAVDEAKRLLSVLSTTGAHLVFEAPKPIFKSPPFRCSDWFNRANSVCTPGFTIEKGELELRRQPVFNDMHQLSGQVSGVAVWDPFPILCPGDRCEAFSSGKPLYFDGDHLSGFGNDILYPDFERFMVSLLQLRDPP